MKKIFALLTCALATQAHAATQEQACLVTAKYAEVVAKARDIDMPEAKLINLISTKPAAPFIEIINLVYTMQMDPAQARQLVYLKCMGTGFGLPSRSGK